ncbi:MAG: hypothetical protein RLZZ338_4227 [Cyanobacteriota bacterium]|jgi:hypothetical protein
MNTTLKATLAAIATTSALLSISTPADAFSFGASGISFEQDTTVNFTFGSSNGYNMYSLGVYEVNNSTMKNVASLFWKTQRSDNGGADDFKGTFGSTVASSTGNNNVNFTFLANKVYSLGLYENFDKNTGLTDKVFNVGGYEVVGSTSGVNFGGYQQAVFGSNLNIDKKGITPFTVNNGALSNYTSANIFNGPVTIGFEDQLWNADKDYNDLTVTASVPEPFTMSGLALGLGGLVTMRRRQQKKASS